MSKCNKHNILVLKNSTYKKKSKYKTIIVYCLTVVENHWKIKIMCIIIIGIKYLPTKKKNMAYVNLSL